MDTAYSVHRISKLNIPALNKIRKILHLAGKDMSEKYGLNHWNNSYFKDWIIVVLCDLKNELYLVKDKDNVVATFQLKQYEDELCFQKLATNPEYAGRGIGSFCISKIEQIAEDRHCKNVICEVYDKSTHAISFYEHRGYSVYDSIATLKYTELKMKKEL